MAEQGSCFFSDAKNNEYILIKRSDNIHATIDKGDKVDRIIKDLKGGTN